MIMLGIGALRAFQGEPEVDRNGLITDDGAVFSQNLSWLPYLIVFGGLLLVVAFLGSRITNKRSLDD